MGNILLCGHAVRFKEHAMMAIFHDMIHIDMEVYVDDILVKSKTHAEHPQALARIL